MRRFIIIPSLLAAAATAATALASSSPATTSNLAAQLALARVATAEYANDLGRAKADGYQIITPMVPASPVPSEPRTKTIAPATKILRRPY